MSAIKYVFEGPAEIEVDDGGQALIVDLDGEHDRDNIRYNEDGGFFVRVQSWSSSKVHPEMDVLRGRRIRVTVEVID